MATGVIPMTEDTGWKRFSNDTTSIGYKVMYRRVGKTVYIKSDGAVSGLESNTPIGSISEDCRTGIEMWFPCFAGYPVYAPNVFLRIYPSGSTTLGLANNSGVTANTSIYISASYILQHSQPYAENGMASGTINKYMDGTDSGWKNLPESTTYTGTIKYRRIGSIFQVKNTNWIKLTSDLAAGSAVLLATIPEEDRVATLFGIAYWNSSPFPILAVKIENGQVRLYNSSSVTITANTNVMLNVISLV